jgi:hypothetical protein
MVYDVRDTKVPEAGREGRRTVESMTCWSRALS